MFKRQIIHQIITLYKRNSMICHIQLIVVLPSLLHHVDLVQEACWRTAEFSMCFPFTLKIFVVFRRSFMFHECLFIALFTASTHTYYILLHICHLDPVSTNISAQYLWCFSWWRFAPTSTRFRLLLLLLLLVCQRTDEMSNE